MAEQPLQLPAGVPQLNSFYLYLTTGCNLACRHCWIAPTYSKGDFATYTKGKLNANQYLSVDLLRQAVLEAKPMGLNSAKLTGGEPTLHPDFIQIVDMLSAEGLQLTMETNGTLIDANLARYLKEKSTLRFISVSLDGATAETHDSLRSVSGSFDAAVRGLKNLANAGYEPQVIMCPHRGNMHEVRDLVKLAVEMGAGSVKFNPITAGGRGSNMHDKGESLDFEEVLAFSRYLSKDLQKITPVPLVIGNPPALLTLKQLELGANSTCRVQNILGILGNGDMALCGIGRTIPEMCFGNLGQDSLRETWISHPTLAQLRKELDEPYPQICADCIHASKCKTHCVAMNYIESGHMVWPSAMCAEADERGVFPDTRRLSGVASNIAGASRND